MAVPAAASNRYESKLNDVDQNQLFSGVFEIHRNAIAVDRLDLAQAPLRASRVPNMAFPQTVFLP